MQRIGEAGALGLGAAAMTGALVASSLLCLRMQRTVWRPIRRLAQAARMVRDKRDYSYRATKAGNGDIGELVDSFNQMLDHLAENRTRRRQLERDILKVSDHEQQRIGQDLHDSVCQQLIRIGFACKALERALADQGRPQAEFAQRILSMLDHVLTESRELAHGLHPVKLASNGGLTKALKDLAAGASEDGPIACNLRCPDPVSVPDPNIATNLYRIAQEAVNNSVRHSEASRIDITLKADDQQIHLHVADDGVGLPEDARDTGAGMGLRIMDYRARVTGGTLEVKRGKTGGTSIYCSVPRTNFKDSRRENPVLHAQKD